VRPKRPTAGKERPGITFSEMNHGRDTDPANRVTIKSESAAGNHLSGNLPGSIVMRQKGCGSGRQGHNLVGESPIVSVVHCVV